MIHSKRIFVTGMAGFIGFHLTQELSKQGYYVVGLDNINDYYSVNLKLDRLTQLGFNVNQIVEGKKIGSTLNPQLAFVKLDLVNSEAIQELFKEEKFTHVIHLAAQAGVRYSIENPASYIQSNLVGFATILEACRHHDIKHLVYASSSSVYGHNKKIPFSEKDNVDHPVSLYAATKKSNELMAYTYSHLYGFQTTGLRFFTVYGPWGRPDMAPMLFADAMVKGQAIKVFNNGEMKRDFTFVDDIVKGIILAMEYKNEEVPKYKVFNIGNSKPVDLMAFIGLMEDNFGVKVQKEMMPMQPGDVKITYADTTSLVKHTGYSPNTSLKEGLKSFVDWYKGYFNV